MSATFNTFDLIFIAFSCIFVVVAFFRGFVKEIFSLLIWISALCVSYFGAPLLAKMLTSYSGNKMVLDIVARTMLFIVTFFALLLSTSSLSKDLKEKMPPILDRSLGVLYGIGKTLLIFGAFYAVIANLYGFLLGKKQDPDGKKVPDWLIEARCGGILKMTGDVIDPAVEAFINSITKNFEKPGFLPKTLDDKIDETFDEDKKIGKDKAKIDDGKYHDPQGQISDETYKQIEKETGYDKKNIDKLGRLIDVIEKIKN